MGWGRGLEKNNLCLIVYVRMADHQVCHLVLRDRGLFWNIADQYLQMRQH